MQHHQKKIIQQPDSTIQATAGWANKKEKLSLQNKILVGGWPPTHQGKKNQWRGKPCGTKPLTLEKPKSIHALEQ